MSRRSRHPRMRSVLFRGCLAAALVAALVFSVTLLLFSARQIDLENDDHLRAEVRQLARAVELGGLDYLNTMGTGADRVTWIAPDGTVQFDSAADADTMDNHKNRQEIRDALENGTGESSRNSDTLGYRTLNFAVRLDDGSVVRISVRRITGLGLLGSAWWFLAAALALAAVAAMAIAARTARRVAVSIDRIDLQNPERTAAYEELQPLIQRIDGQNRQLHDQMEHMAQEHEQQDRFRREFTANVSHELKTPLTSISGFAEIIRDGMVRPADIPRFAGNIYREAQRLITLVGDIIKITQMDDKQIPIQREPLDLRQLCSDVLSHLEPAADAAGVRCYLEGDEGLPTVSGAQQIADEMIYNLCDNAIKYNRPGGVVKVRVTAQGTDAVAVTVEDSGIGIPPEHQARVFERFYRVDKNRSKEKGGTGLGLSIVKHGALYHGAALRLESKPGAGTRITVTFPTQPPAQ